MQKKTIITISLIITVILIGIGTIIWLHTPHPLAPSEELPENVQVVELFNRVEQKGRITIFTNQTIQVSGVAYRFCDMNEINATFTLNESEQATLKAIFDDTQYKEVTSSWWENKMRCYGCTFGPAPTPEEVWANIVFIGSEELLIRHDNGTQRITSDEINWLISRSLHTRGLCETNKT